MATTSKTAKQAPVYENNPFFVAVNGLELFFKKAQTIGIIFAVIVALSAFGSIPSSIMPPDNQSSSPEQIAREDQAFTSSLAAVPGEVWLLIVAAALTIIVIFVFIGVTISGIADYTASKLADDEEVGFSEALRAVFQNFWGYLWVQIIVFIKVLLWSLLLIVPGIIMAIRYSLSGTIYFDRKLKGNTATKESSRLIKGAWLTTFASYSLFNIITLGIIELLLSPGTRAILYRQYKAYDNAKIIKPKTHILSWLTLIIPIILLIILILAAIVLVAAFANYYQTV